MTDNAGYRPTDDSALRWEDCHCTKCGQPDKKCECVALTPGTKAIPTEDLLGDPLPETPAMSAPLPWRVFRMDDYDWWVAHSLEEAKASYQHQTGVDDEAIEDARELTEQEMDKLHFVDIDERERPVNKSRRTFRVELAQRVEAGLSKPELFACTEY